MCKKWAWAIALLGAAGLSSSLGAQGLSLEKIRILTLVGTPLPVLVGQMRGSFAARGVEVVPENYASSDAMRSALAAGKGDAAYAAVDNAVAMVATGGADAIIVSGGEGSQNEVIVQPEIKSMQDLKGKTLLVDAVNTAYALQLKSILLHQGLEVDRDFQLKPFGATPLRLTALLKNKDFAGSMLGPPSSISALRGGLKSLGSVPVLIGVYQASGHFAMRAWAEGHRDLLVNYLAAYVESQRWMMDPVNKQQVMDVMVKQAHLSAGVAAETYEMSMTKPGGFERDALLDPVGFANVLKIRAEVEGRGKAPAARYYDARFYQAALGKIRQ